MRLDHGLALFTGNHFRYYYACVSGDADLYLSAIAALQNIFKPGSKIIPLYTLCGLPGMDLRSNHCQFNGITG